MKQDIKHNLNVLIFTVLSMGLVLSLTASISVAQSEIYAIIVK